MYTARRIGLLALLTAALASVTARAAAQETEYDPQGRRLPTAVAPVPDGYIAATDDPPASPAPAPSDAVPPGAPPAGAIPAPPPAAEAPAPGPYRVEGDGAPRYPRAPDAGPDGATGAVNDDTTDEGVRIPPRISARLRVLDRDYAALSVRGSNGIVDGILALVTGGISIGLGAALADSSNGLATYLYVLGGGTIAHGLVDLILTPDPVEPALIFAHMPMGTVDEVKARLRFGEESRVALADRSRLTRILEGSLDIATGVAFVPFYLGQREALEVGVLDIVVMTVALIGVITGVAKIIMRSEAERRWSAYDTLRENLRQQRREQHGVRANVGAAALPGGGALTLSGSF